VNVINNQTQNLTAAEDTIIAANIPQQVANLSQFHDSEPVRYLGSGAGELGTVKHS